MAEVGATVPESDCVCGLQAAERKKNAREIYPGRLLERHVPPDEQRGSWHDGREPRRGYGYPVWQDRIRQSSIGYINNIYDNAQVEMETDNMEQMIVENYYELQAVYGMPDPPSFTEVAASLDLWEGHLATKEVGMLYAPERTEGSDRPPTSTCRTSRSTRGSFLSLASPSA